MSVGELEITRNTSEVAVCCSRDSRDTFNSRAFSIAIMAWSAKFCTSAICFSVKGRTPGGRGRTNRSNSALLDLRSTSEPCQSERWRGRASLRMYRSSCSRPQQRSSLDCQKAMPLSLLSFAVVVLSVRRRNDLLDHVVGPDEQVRRDFKTERPSASQVDHQIEPSRQHERQFANLFAF